jgi:uncharacterized protein (TIGR02646 family)
VIRIKKPTKAPAVLANRGETATRQFCAEYESSSETAIDFRFDSRIYAAKSVKAALQRAQHDKCAFCESKISHIAYGDVEHFRPKSGYRQNPNDPLTRPGYYWLAYDWGNLLLCCQLCNQQHKANHFPLMETTQRARSHRDDIKFEQPLLIHPAEEEPQDFLEFHGASLRASGGNERGTVTIRLLELNRHTILERRLDVLAIISAEIKIRELLSFVRAKYNHSDPFIENEIAAIDERLEKSAVDSAEYAAMVRAALKRRGLRSD